MPKSPLPAAPPTISRSTQVEFHALAAGGEAVGRDELGKTVFAPFGAPGDVALTQIEVEKPAFARGFIREILTASPERIAPPCPQFRPETPTESCGGCTWQHVSLAAQRAAKRDIVVAALRRICGLDEELAQQIVAPLRGGAGFGTRNKADFVIGRGENGPEIGFYARESHHLIDAATCPIQNSRNEAILRAAREILAQNPDFAFDPKTKRGLWQRLIARTASNGEALATLILSDAASTGDQAAQIARLLRERVPELVGVVAAARRGDAKALSGRDFLIESANSLDFRVSGGAFWQVNTEMSPQLALAALELAAVQSGETALDLFCGAGFFALHLARAGAVVTGIETHRGAIADATHNAKTNGLRAQFRAGDAQKSLSRFGDGDFSLVLLDPPRAGARECLGALLKIRPRRLIYVSCDPATWARDAKILGENGYALRRAIPFDLFPQTAHVEVVSQFDLGATVA